MRTPPKPRKKICNGIPYVVVTLPDGSGKRKDKVLGRWDSPRAETEYSRLIQEWETNGRRLNEAKVGGSDLTINELLDRFWEHVERYYRHPDGSPTSEVDNHKLSLRPLRFHYEHTLAREFGPLALKAVRKAMVTGYEHPEYGPQDALARRGQPTSVASSGCSNGPWRTNSSAIGVPGSKRSRRESRPLRRQGDEARQPVAEPIIEAVLPHVLLPVRAMLEVQLLTGMRPGEVVVMRRATSTRPARSGTTASPATRTAWRGHERIVALGPKAQAVIRPFLKPSGDAFLFSPRDAIEALRKEKRENRKTKVQPSQADRKKKSPKKGPGDRYSVRSYSQAVAKGCMKADAAAHEEDDTLAAETVIVPQFHPHQIRHTTANRLRREFGLDTARVVLGHKSAQITEVYAALDNSKAAEVMAKLG